MYQLPFIVLSAQSFFLILFPDLLIWTELQLELRVELTADWVFTTPGYELGRCYCLKELFFEETGELLAFVLPSPLVVYCILNNFTVRTAITVHDTLVVRIA